MSSKESVKVYARFRPFNKLEIDLGEGESTSVVSYKDKKNVEVLDWSKTESCHGEAYRTPFAFDRIFNDKSTQQTIFEDIGEPIVDNVLAGYNGCLFAYGQTGSGKTFSMSGPNNDPSDDLCGLIPRILHKISVRVWGVGRGEDDSKHECDSDDDDDSSEEHTFKHWDVKCLAAYMEIYNGLVVDLMTTKVCRLRSLGKSAKCPTGLLIEGLYEVRVSSFAELIGVVERGQKHRKVSGTRMNSESSRSHALLRVTLSSVHKSTSAKRTAELWLVDLAGSEKAKKTESVGQRFKEGVAINTSLTFLGNCIKELAKGHKPHFRMNPLTQLLENALTGNCKTGLLLAASPSRYNMEETLSTMRFGKRAKAIKIKVTKNTQLTAAKYQVVIAQLARAQLTAKAILQSTMHSLGAVDADIFGDDQQFDELRTLQQYMDRVQAFAKRAGLENIWLHAAKTDAEGSSKPTKKKSKKKRKRSEDFLDEKTEEIKYEDEDDDDSKEEEEEEETERHEELAGMLGLEAGDIMDALSRGAPSSGGLLAKLDVGGEDGDEDSGVPKPPSLAHKIRQGQVQLDKRRADEMALKLAQLREERKRALAASQMRIKQMQNALGALQEAWAVEKAGGSRTTTPAAALSVDVAAPSVERRMSRKASKSRPRMATTPSAPKSKAALKVKQRSGKHGRTPTPRSMRPTPGSGRRRNESLSVTPRSGRRVSGRLRSQTMAAKSKTPTVTRRPPKLSKLSKRKSTATASTATAKRRSVKSPVSSSSPRSASGSEWKARAFAGDLKMAALCAARRQVDGCGMAEELMAAWMQESRPQSPAEDCFGEWDTRPLGDGSLVRVAEAIEAMRPVPVMSKATALSWLKAERRLTRVFASRGDDISAECTGLRDTVKAATHNRRVLKQVVELVQIQVVAMQRSIERSAALADKLQQRRLRSVSRLSAAAFRKMHPGGAEGYHKQLDSMLDAAPKEPEQVTLAELNRILESEGIQQPTAAETGTLQMDFEQLNEDELMHEVTLDQLADIEEDDDDEGLAFATV